MKWINHYQLFLFDFDGILVNTEHLHYKAYLKMCSNRGYSLHWDEKTYLRHAIYSAGGIRDGIYRELPLLQKDEGRWEILYQEKKAAYFDFLLKEGVSLIAGVERLLIALENANIKRCVVTNSTHEQIMQIRKQQPLLDSIPFWLTREHYQEPKPSSECYIKAISMFSEPKDQIIGFEDSPRGLKALVGTRAKGILISDYVNNSEVAALSAEIGKSFDHFSSFAEFFKKQSG